MLTRRKGRGKGGEEGEREERLVLKLAEGGVRFYEEGRKSRETEIAELEAEIVRLKGELGVFFNREAGSI